MRKLTSLNAEDDALFDLSFDWGESLGVPGALIVRNQHHSQTYLPAETLEPLLFYRQQELVSLRGTGSGMLKEWDRVYDYAYYSDLGMPEKGHQYARPVLGGRTIPTLVEQEPNIPILKVIVPEVKALLDKTINEFDTFEDIIRLYEGGVKLPDSHYSHSLKKIRQCVPWELVRELIRSEGEHFLKFPVPVVIKGDKTVWRTDEEFGREMLAGVNPVVIQRLQEFPPRSKLDLGQYGDQDSRITREHLHTNMNGLTVDEAIEKNKMFILDHHDALMPYLRRINTTTTKTYATRTILLLQGDGTLKPLAIELSFPHENGDALGAISQVFTPCDHGVGNAIWQLAKAYVAVSDSGYHPLISHWYIHIAYIHNFDATMMDVFISVCRLNTHAVIEPFVIATNRQLSTLHPIHKLLKPHFRDTIHINALARQILINAGGVLEITVFPARYAMEMSSFVYRNWNFTEQALPVDLIKRGVAVPDESHPYGLKLLIEDYPFAVDGLEVWNAIEAWDKPWLPKMETRAELIEACTIVIWVASALHAAVNFGQYPYAGYLPNRPTLQTLLGVSLIEILSRHSRDEIYLGQRDNPEWTNDELALEAFDRFRAALVEIEKRIRERNEDKTLKNRYGLVEVPYMLLYPNTSDYSREGGLTGKGIPNSISI
ncbi:hypothetical protein SASPL_112295 [Salvia splendens]|uniref:Lipoxygenase n=1 Tax=Salvia splendens TaxID=180675 RepID=A0A8X8YCE1_SALSN|nr:hypothetical protein SASPL_112295 [Salvia splendens]